MPKKQQSKSSPSKARTKPAAGSPKQTTAKAATANRVPAPSKPPQPIAAKPPVVSKPAEAPAPAPTPSAQPAAAASKYDQPGAPWWKKFRPESGASASKR